MGAMYQFSESTMLTIRVISSVLQFIGILVALFRLWFRLQIRRLWWEDAWALIACVCAIVLLTSEWMYLEGGWVVSVVGYWVYALMLTCVVWAVRMSVLFSIARIAHPTEHMRRIVTALAVFFSLISLTFMAMKLWWFTQDLSWLKKTAFYTRPARRLPDSMYIYELCTDCISDTILISLPVRLLWGMNLPTKQRMMIIAIFSSRIIVVMVSIFRAVSQIMNLLFLIGVAVDIEVACCTITCNLLVVATVIYRCSRSASTPNVSELDPEDDNYMTPVGARVTTPALTTVDFSDLDCWEDSSQQGSCDTRLESR